MAEPINLRRVRKAKARQDAQAEAAQARLSHAISKASKARQKALQDQKHAQLEAHKREPKP